MCDGDNFAATPHQFCLNQNPLTLRHDGTFPYNVENLMEATWTIGGKQVRWSLEGGASIQDGNHAKWAVGTPRDGSPSSLAVFADLNMEGFPCSRDCNGSQGGRGGSFYGLNNNALRASLVNLITNVCKCASSGESSFVDASMCGDGCTSKVSGDVPVLGKTQSF
ncbi:Aste57867_13539 [Aphanomyces stellatus]|uniref:Aste57867_13539 protein n=1 Tax=Aphanomyces stellatus TaxID=120398 RepID=A0A485KZ93_9STRA|nr:hypothetical protein As57867_013489 [Aphanomyces stellatus]VFT90377.1 Aste57867_13539 [Aphanomyces stellatus]